MTPLPEAATARQKSCPVCAGVFHLWLVRDARRYLRCQSCGFLLVPEGIAVDANGKSIYESGETSVFQVDGNEGYYFDHATNLANSRRKLEFVQRHLPQGSRLLDAGANFGHFLRVAGEAYEVSGFDLSPGAVSWSRQHFSVASVVGSVYDPPRDGAPWDAVTSWDVIEHLSDPFAALHRLCGLLRPRGWLFLSTPDAKSFVARTLGRRWHYLDPVQHIALFGRSSIASLLEQTGFAVVRMSRLGHSYRIRYVFDRLCYLHSRGLTGHVLRMARLLVRPVAGLSVYIQLGDVVAVAAQRRE